MTELPNATGVLLGKTPEDITGTVWLLGHDLKSPIAIVISTLEMLIVLHEADEAMASTVQLLRGALAAANREYNMVSDVLDLARLELGQYEFEKQTTDLRELLRACLDDENHHIFGKKVHLKIEISEKPLLADVDVELFRRSFCALLDNALKFTVREDRLEVTARQIDRTIEIIFADSGRAIFADFQQDITQRAPQWDKRQAGSRTSVGMGIPFVNAVVKSHGGQFICKSDPATKMTSFTLTLPIASIDEK